jgi:FKBP-type peptidyl-prolyl cis-trans isomerase
MKKFLLLPLLLAAGFGVLVVVNSEPPGGGKGEVGKEITTDSGLKYTDLKIGEGKEAKKGGTVVAHYVGTLADGTKFDSSYDRGQPATFPLTNVIEGWKEGIPGMKVGGKRKLVIPAELGYGKRGTPDGKVPPDAELIFEVELVDVK